MDRYYFPISPAGGTENIVSIHQIDKPANGEIVKVFFCEPRGTFSLFSDPEVSK
jgi:hypothetical protein